jgi:uncharacterized protein YlxW (UPF0749 family)
MDRTKPVAKGVGRVPGEPAARHGWIWRGVVPVICLLAGFGFAVSAHESRGTELRPPATANLSDLVRAAEVRVQVATGQAAGLEREVSRATAAAGAGDARVAAAQAKSAPLRLPGGLTAVHGPGIEVVLDDVGDTDDADDPVLAGVDPTQLVVHQADLQAVVNALWAGGAEAMTIAGQRVIATSAVRCVGNTLLLNGEVFSPPFQVAAIGPYRTMSEALDGSPGVDQFEQAAAYYGLGYTVASADDLDLPGYTGSIALGFAHAGP